MALTFKTTDLIKVAQAAIDGKAKALAKYEADKYEARFKYQQKWVDANTERVRELRDFLSKCLRNGTVPTTKAARRIMGQIDGYKYDGVSFFDGGGDGGMTAPRGTYIDANRWTSLIALLKAHKLDTITAHQIKELGYHPKDLERLFSDAVIAGAAV